MLKCDLLPLTNQVTAFASVPSRVTMVAHVTISPKPTVVTPVCVQPVSWGQSVREGLTVSHQHLNMIGSYCSISSSSKIEI